MSAATRRAAKRRFATAGGFLLAAALLVPAARAADEDGGTESVFATGAGNRALALGGAFTALADDASAPVWNPAGLGRLARREFVVSHASLYGLDVAEQHVALAWPSWRWGTGALSIRRLGVDAIERRSPRNVLLGKFGNSDLEIALAYGRPAGEAWHLGGAVKMHRQRVGGFSDSGIGLDLGLQVHPAVALGREGEWTRRLLLGLSLRNAVAPTIRLDETAVSDPVSVRAGAAYRTPFLNRGAIAAAVDVEKARDAALDVHAGLEVTPHPLLALRTGWNGDGFTAGTGVTWDLYRFDYVYEDNEIDPVHRFGVSIGFGATTAERRMAARSAEDDRFRKRLEETFDRRRQQQVEELFASVHEALKSDRLDEASRLIETIRALSPDDSRITAVETTALARQAELAEARGEFAAAAILWARVLALSPDDMQAAAGRNRCRLESDRRAERSARIRELFAAALDAFTGGEFPTARAHLEDILRLAPGDVEAKNMLARTQSAITLRLASLLDQARRALDRGVLDAAGAHLTAARALDPSADGLAALDSRLQAAERELQRAARNSRNSETMEPVSKPAVAKAPTLSRKRQKEIAELYRSGMDAMREERPDDALRYWELVWVADPAFQNVAEFLKREYLMRGLESFSRGGLDEAIRLWEKALDVDPADQKTLGYLSRAREQLSRSNEILGGEGGR